MLNVQANALNVVLYAVAERIAVMLGMTAGAMNTMVIVCDVGAVAGLREEGGQSKCGLQDMRNSILLPFMSS